MPELPEVETVRRGLAPVLVGKTIARVTVRRPDLRFALPGQFAERLAGRRVNVLTRRGKFLLAMLDDGVTWLMHLGMSGCFRLGGDERALDRHDHVVMVTEDDVPLVYHDPRRFGFMDLLRTEEIDPRFRGLGRDPLTQGFSAAYLQPLLAGRATPIKVALLDQRVVAGMGNIYASESLFAAGIAPKRPAGSLRADEIEALVRCIKDVLTRAIAVGGATLRDHRHPTGELGCFQNEFSVYHREGMPCVRCAAAEEGANQGPMLIARVAQGGRSTFYCPACQR